MDRIHVVQDRDKKHLGSKNAGKFLISCGNISFSKKDGVGFVT